MALLLEREHDMSLKKSLVWFRRDLRAFDHAALHHALASSASVDCVFIYDQAILAPLERSDRRVAFIHASLAELDAELRRLGGHLIVRHGAAPAEIARLANELGVDAVFANADYEPQALERDAAVEAALVAAGRRFALYKDQVIFERDEVLTLAGTPFGVFTPYKNAWLKRLAAEPDCVAPFAVEPLAARLVAAPPGHALPSLAEIGFEPGGLDALGIGTGMSAGARLFDAFLGRIGRYDVARDFPAQDAGSGLSLHLRFGTVSIRHLVRSVCQLIANGAGGGGAPVWLSELIWREFYAMILAQHPRVVNACFKPAFERIEWESGPAAEAAFEAWCAGRTGYPLIDAAMIELKRSGQMHNRLRMVTASFLVKDLGIDWRWGERHFAQQLNDYDLASNNGGWQWAASTGCDAQPWFRIFNPVTQSEKFDADGQFIRAVLPQLARLDARQIHAPWLLAPELLAQKGIRLGRDYWPPLVMHDAARARTLARYAVVKAP
jgi:deoxyribodipyrimidine photo-lyase